MRVGRPAACPARSLTAAAALGAAGLAGAVLLAASVPMSARSLMHDVTYGTGALATAPAVLAYPVWLIVLSYRLPGHLADHTGAVASAAEPWEVT